MKQATQTFREVTRSLATLGAVCLSLSCAGAAIAQTTAPIVELRGARWFTGQTFVRGTRWMQNGAFVNRPQAAADSVVDLSNSWMVPPFADAHTHSPDGEYAFDGIRDMYLRLGVFYVQTLTNHISGRREIASRVNIPGSIDVAFADAAVTSTGGHPHVLYASLALYRRFWQTDAEKFAAARSRLGDNDAYYRLDSLAQLPAVIARLARDTVPILKVMLVESERWQVNHTDSTKAGFYGLNPELLAPLVDAAHKLGRRVWAHVDTPYDMEIALRAGVDAFAHVPGYGAWREADSVAQRLIIPDSTIRLAGAKRVQMTATLIFGSEISGADSAAQQRRFRDVSVRNVRALRAAGVTMLAGSDTYSNAEYVAGDPMVTARELKLSPRDFLRLWAVDTPRAIFPARRIGDLAPGFEASALALSCNPLTDTTCVTKIARRLKQGVWITVRDKTP
jgi:imidazolonepropionase-like amidohydrolase